MSRLERLIGKPIEIEINGEKFMIEPLTINELPIVMKTANKETQAEGLREMIRITLKKAVPDATDEEIGAIEIKHLQALSEAITEVNNLPKQA